MSEPTTRKPLRIVNDEAQTEDRPWRVRLENGEIRGPLNSAGLRSLLEVGIVTAKSEVSLVADEQWQILETHSLWSEIKPKDRPYAFRNPDPVVKGAAPSVAPGDVAIKPERLERMRAAQQAALDRTARGLAFWEVSRVLRVLRDVVVFFAFLTFGDLITSFFNQSLGLVKGGVLLCLTVVALMYYSFRAMEK